MRVLLAIASLAICFMVALAISAAAQGWPPREDYAVHHDPQAGDAWFARITIWNPDGSATSVWTAETSKGPVHMTYGSSPNGGCEHDPQSCADLVTITDLPAGVTPSEWEAEIHENTTYTIYLFEYLGG